MTSRIVIIGGGHNGLVAAFYLARAGLRPLVLERRDRVGGGAVTGELIPGFRVPTLAHAFGSLRSDIAADLDLARRGLELIEPAITSVSPSPDGRALVLARDAARTARLLTAWSQRDAARYSMFLQAVTQGASLIAELARHAPLSIDGPGPGDLWRLLLIGRRFRALGRADGYRLLRMAPMPIADLAEDWFETDVLRAAVATRGIFGTNLGPRSAGTVATLLVDAASNSASPGAPTYVRGGLGRLTECIAAAATEAGAEIRTGAEVSRIDVDDSGARGVVLATGEQIPADVVVSNADPKRTLLGLIDPLRLDPEFLVRMRNLRARGTVAKVNLALAGLPSFLGVADLSELAPAEALSGRILIAPDIDYLEQAFDASKYGELSPRPFLECVIPTLTDPSLAPDGRHVMSVYVQYAPYELRGCSWSDRRDTLQRAVINTLATYASDLAALVLAAETITPEDLERDYGLSGGHIYHGEIALDQLYLMRPLLGWAQHRTPIKGLYLCSAGTHPGGGLTGASGANAARVVIKDRA